MCAPSRSFYGYQGESCLLVRPALQMLRGLGEDDLEGRAHVGFQEVPAPRRAVGPAYHHVSVYLRLPVILGSYVPYQREDFDLLLYRDLFVLLPLYVEVA